MGSGFYAALRTILLEHGCTLLRQGKGSHQVWYSPITKVPVTISVTVNSRHTANDILKQAGIGKRF
jgi:predicted RNA binding protein YcfA (HicA-like mRNA interferase family)